MKYSLVSMFFLFSINFMASAVYAHSLPLNIVAVEACEQKKKSQVCQYSGHHGDLYIGTCQLVTQEKLICVRNKPIQKIEADTVKSKVVETNENSN